MAAIYDFRSGDTITDGLQGSSRCDEAIQAARRIAAENGRPVLLVDGDRDHDLYVGPRGGIRRVKRSVGA